MTTGFGYETYPQFEIQWSDHALGAVLYRLPLARGPQHRRLVWCAAWLASEAGYEVRSESGSIYVALPTGVVVLNGYGGDSLLISTERESIKAFCEQQLQGLPKPDPEAMRYGQAAYPPDPALGGTH